MLPALNKKDMLQFFKLLNSYSGLFLDILKWFAIEWRCLKIIKLVLSSCSSPWLILAFARLSVATFLCSVIITAKHWEDIWKKKPTREKYFMFSFSVKKINGNFKRIFIKNSNKLVWKHAQVRSTIVPMFRQIIHFHLNQTHKKTVSSSETKLYTLPAYIIWIICS